MQVILPRAVLFFLSVAIAVFCYYESIYYADHAASLGARSAADVRTWMWVFRGISAITLVFALVLTIDLFRKLFY
jgi:hypothetical protein